jgi:hypothetical protein
VTGPDPWASSPHDPRRPENARLRASDADREVVLGVLGEAYADGRLTREELDERSAQAASSRTLGELPPLLADLLPAAGSATPVPVGAADLDRAAHERYARRLREALWGFVSISAIVWVIWVITGPDSFPWPAFVSLAAALNAGRLVVQRRDVIADERRRLEKKARKAHERGLERGQGDDVGHGRGDADGGEPGRD